MREGRGKRYFRKQFHLLIKRNYTINWGANAVVVHTVKSTFFSFGLYFNWYHAFDRTYKYWFIQCGRLGCLFRHTGRLFKSTRINYGLWFIELRQRFIQFYWNDPRCSYPFETHSSRMEFELICILCTFHAISYTVCSNIFLWHRFFVRHHLLFLFCFFISFIIEWNYAWTVRIEVQSHGKFWLKCYVIPETWTHYE